MFTFILAVMTIPAQVSALGFVRLVMDMKLEDSFIPLVVPSAVPRLAGLVFSEQSRLAELGNADPANGRKKSATRKHATNQARNLRNLSFAPFANACRIGRMRFPFQCSGSRTACKRALPKGPCLQSLSRDHGISGCQVINKGLSQLDAEGVIWHSSPYKSTAESQSATKNTI